MSHTCTCACVCECVCARVCACVCINNEITPFSGFLLSHYKHTTYILVHLPNFLSCETIFFFICAIDVASCGESDLHLIRYMAHVGSSENHFKII